MNRLDHITGDTPDVLKYNEYKRNMNDLTVNSARYQNGRTPIECVTGDTPDVSDFGLENEDDEFLDEFNRIIDDSDLAEANGLTSC